MISNPIKGYINKKYPKGNVTQWVGENIPLYASINIGLTKGHNGIDITSPWGTPMYAVEAGIVCEVKTDPSGYGMHLRFLTETDEKVNREWTYGHCSAIFVKVGQRIKAGELIANMGNTGFVVSSTNVNAGGFWANGGNNYEGTHLHLGCREITYSSKGWRYSKETKKFITLNYDNGRLGAIDFSSMFNPDRIMGDIEILKRELEKTPEDDWWTRLLKAFKFFGN